MARRINVAAGASGNWKNITTLASPDWMRWLRTRELGWQSKYGWNTLHNQNVPQLRLTWPFRRISAAILSEPMQEMGLAMDRFGRSLLPEEHKKEDGFLTHRRVNVVEGRTPSVNRQYQFIAPSATILGQVEMAHDVAVWYDAVVREGVDPEKNPTVIERQVKIMDRAVVIGARIASGAIIEANATVQEGAVIGVNAIIGARACVESGAIIEDRAQIAAGVTVPAGVRVPANTYFNAVGVTRTVNPEDTKYSTERWNEIHCQGKAHNKRASMETHEYIEERYVIAQLAHMAERSKPMQEDVWQERKRGRGVLKH